MYKFEFIQKNLSLVKKFTHVFFQFVYNCIACSFKDDKINQKKDKLFKSKFLCIHGPIFVLKAVTHCEN